MGIGKLFVSNIDYAITNDKLKEIFAEAGSPTKITIAFDRATGRSRGYAFLEMASSEEAKKAIEILNGKSINGRPLSVAEDISERGSSSSSTSKNGSTPQTLVPPMPRVFMKKKRKVDPFLEDSNLTVDFKDVRMLTRFMSERGKILPRKLTGLSAFNQRKVAKAIKRAQNTGLMAYTTITG